MASISTQLVLIFSFFVLLMANAVVVALPSYATTAAATPATPAPTSASEQPKPGIIMIITFENGTTKAIRSDSTNLQAVNGGYFIADSSVKASQPIQSKSISNTVVKQLVSVFVDISIDDTEPPLPPTPVKEEGGACAALYTYNPETGQCELPSAEQPPVEPEPAPQPEPEPEPAPEPDPGNGDQNDGGDNGNNDGEEGGGGDGSDGEGGGGDNSGGGDEGAETD